MRISPIIPNYKQNLYYNKPSKKQALDFKSRFESRREYTTPPFGYYSTLGLNITNSEHIDRFTGLLDKESLMYALDTMITNSRRTGQEFSIAMFDMDNFKSVNELLGYTVGDEFIKIISGNINAVSKQNGVKAYRYGGEEFVLIFDRQSDDTIEDVTSTILEVVGSDQTIQSYASEYRKKAQERLTENSTNYKKINDIETLEVKKKLIKDLKTNLTSEEARNDPYLNRVLDDIDSELKVLYLNLIDELLENKSNVKMTDFLTNVRTKIENSVELNKQEQQTLKEYLWSIYDKSYEIHRIKKWLSDFDKNRGFSITGGVIRYNSHAPKYKEPVDVITEVGEMLKRGKSHQKGKGYKKS